MCQFINITPSGYLCSLLITLSYPYGNDDYFHFDEPEMADCPLLSTHLALVVKNWLFSICGQYFPRELSKVEMC